MEGNRMSTKLKLKLKDIKIQSFITSLDNEEKEKVKGGISGAACPYTYVCATRICTAAGICTFVCNPWDTAPYCTPVCTDPQYCTEYCTEIMCA